MVKKNQHFFFISQTSRNFTVLHPVIMWIVPANMWIILTTSTLVSALAMSICTIVRCAISKYHKCYGLCFSLQFPGVISSTLQRYHPFPDSPDVSHLFPHSRQKSRNERETFRRKLEYLAGAPDQLMTQNPIVIN